jgi:hypothetical protein
MPGTQEFTPDDVYCVYCHAPASGPCATCGALCCADCVELVMGLTTHRAVCRNCNDENRRPAEARAWPWIGAGLALAVVLGLALLAFL